MEIAIAMRRTRHGSSIDRGVLQGTQRGLASSASAADFSTVSIGISSGTGR